MKLRMVRVDFGPDSISTTPTVEWEGDKPYRAFGPRVTRIDGRIQTQRYFEVQLRDRWQPLLFDPRDSNNRDKMDALRAYVEIERGALNLSCTCVTTSDELRRFLERLALYTE